MKLKRTLCLLCALSLCFLTSCGQKKKNITKTNLPFTVKTVTLSEREEMQPNYQNEYYFFQSENELAKGREALEQYFDLSTVAVESEGSFADAISRYDAEFFKNKALLFVKRFHSTDAKLELTGIDVEHGDFILHADLESGAPPISAFRAYLVELDKASYISNAAEIKTDIHEVESEAPIFEKKLTICFGNAYKVVADEELAKRIQTDILSQSFGQTDFDPDTHEHDSADITVLGPCIYATFTKDYIGIGAEAYAPDETMYNRLRDFYVSLDSEQIPLEKEQTSDNINEKE